MMSAQRLNESRSIWLCIAGLVLNTFLHASDPNAIHGNKGVASADSWPMYRGGPALDGLSPAK